MEQKAIPQIAMTEVASSQIHSIGHDAASNTLAIRFKGKNGPGSLYHYAGVDAARFDEFAKAESKGSHFKQTIQVDTKSYPYTRIDEPVEQPKQAA